MMAFAEAYRRQVELLIRALPSVAAEACFAMKGGTAINLFVRDLPRLSVDIDLTYLPVEDRATSLTAIDVAMLRAAERITGAVRGSRVTPSRSSEGVITKLVVRTADAQIKIEVTPVLRGCVFEPGVRAVVPVVEDEFGFAEMRIVSFPDLYAGKIVAALDRQHPRDLFDVRDLLANEGIDDALRRAFLVYLISHDRPMHEVLGVRRKDIAAEFERGFAGMTREPVSLDELLVAREALVSEIIGLMPSTHRDFLLAFERGKPNWDELNLQTAADLPAVRWRQQNLDSIGGGKASGAGPPTRNSAPPLRALNHWGPVGAARGGVAFKRRLVKADLRHRQFMKPA